ncbi:MAG: recombinase RecJ [Oscillibacter sp.]|nr:recombinase RecJ [Oscillibacter sp.]
MNLSALLDYEKIVIQCHDNPDADALASGFALLRFFQKQGKSARFVYGGAQAAQKSNLLLMMENLSIPVSHVMALEEQPDLLLAVDCQYGERNVQPLAEPQTLVAVIDHHKAKLDPLPPLWEVRDNYGSCATIVWDMLNDAGFDPGDDEALATALYYGLFMDTGKMQELRHPKDMDMRDALEFRCSKPDLFHFQNCNLTLNELEIAGRAFGNYDFNQEYRFAVAQADRCDPNILGVISDTLMEVDVVNVCIAYCMLDSGAKLSVRSCVRETRADELAAYVAQGLGSGGGHPQKSGGFLMENLVTAEYERRFGPVNGDSSAAVRALLTARLEDYFQEQEDVLYNGLPGVPDLTNEPLYQKKRLPIGYVRAADLYPVGTKVAVRMLEGDFTLTVQEDTYFIIGVEAEVYKNDESYFLSHNDPSDQPYQFQGEYAPTVHESIRAAGASACTPRRTLTQYARTCIPKSGPKAHARQITRRTKVFVPWSENYMLGLPGDWLVSRAENPLDIYIVKKDIFPKTYEPC